MQDTVFNHANGKSKCSPDKNSDDKFLSCDATEGHHCSRLRTGATKIIKISPNLNNQDRTKDERMNTVNMSHEHPLQFY